MKDFQDESSHDMKKLITVTNVCFYKITPKMTYLFKS